MKIIKKLDPESTLSTIWDDNHLEEIESGEIQICKRGALPMQFCGDGTSYTFSIQGAGLLFHHHNMSFNDLDYEDLIRILTDSFTVLADEVQLLNDRKLILEHKLQFAKDQYQKLADRCAPGESEVASTLAKLQLPPDLHLSTPNRGGIPLPQRQHYSSRQTTAIAIRDGRKVVQRLAVLSGRTGSTVSGRSISGTSSNMRLSAYPTSLSTVLEQDFTVPGKKSSLLCPFAPPNQSTMNPQPSHGSGTLDSDRPLTPRDATPHQSSDPICAAMYAETMSSPPPSASGSAAKCPIRYLDQHSPEEVARYFETHKHEIPRSHEICVKRYQRNEDDIRKLDAKYGNLVSMIQGLGQKHQPMLPGNQEDGEVEEDAEAERASNERVENWAKAVSTNGVGTDEEEVALPGDEDDRESRFDRHMKEIRVGESPSRPWGISVPILDPPGGERPESPPPAPVSAGHEPKPVGKCPFDHGAQPQEKPAPRPQIRERPAGKCPFPHAAAQKAREEPELVPHYQPQPSSPHYETQLPDPRYEPQPPAPHYGTQTHYAPRPTFQSQPTFIQSPEVQKMNSSVLPQMIFTGPVFIGYPMDQAIQFMNQYRGP